MNNVMQHQLLFFPLYTWVMGEKVCKSCMSTIILYNTIDLLISSLIEEHNILVYIKS